MTTTTAAPRRSPVTSIPRARIPVARIVAVELRKSFDTRAGFWLLASIGIAALLTSGAVIAWAPREQIVASQFTLAIGIPMSVILPIIAVLSVTAEWSQRSGLTTFALVPHRGRVLLAKGIAAVLVAAAATLVAFAVGSLGNLAGSGLADVPTVWDQDLADVGYFALGQTLLLLVGFTLGALIRNSPGAIVSYMVYAFVAPGLLAFLAFNQAWFRDLRPWVDAKYNQDALLQGGLAGEQWTQLAVTTVVWLVLPARGRSGEPAPLGGEVTMTRAVVQDHYGSPDVLTLTEVPTPVPGRGEVLVAVRAASLNARDWHVMRGEPRMARLMDRDTFARQGPRVATRGTDLAGIVEAVGDSVTRWRPGDLVFGEGTGAFADHAVVPADQLAAIPAGVTFEQAAALPLAATTAQLCLDAAAPSPGQSILVNGASGGVGTFAIQLAQAQRLHVTAVVSTRNTALAGSLGADRVIDYTRDDFTQGGAYDVVLDLVGNRRLRELRGAVRPGGALVLSGGGVSGQGRIVGPIRLLVWAQLVGRFSGLRVLTPQAAPDAEVLARLARLVAAGQLTPVIDRSFGLEQTADAIRYVETQHASAKVVITTR